MLTKTDRFWVTIMRLNRHEKRKEIRKTWRVGRIEIGFVWRSKTNMWGRFGGGWNWKLGFQSGATCVVFNLLICSISISKEEKKC